MSTIGIVVGAVCVLSLASLVLQVLSQLRKPAIDLGALQDMTAALQVLSSNAERVERALREEIAKNREEALSTARNAREELAGLMKANADTMHQILAGTSQASELKQEKLREVVERQLVQIAHDNSSKLELLRDQSQQTAQILQDATTKRLDKMRQEASDGIAKVRDEVTLALKTFDASVTVRQWLSDQDLLSQGNRRREGLSRQPRFDAKRGMLVPRRC